MKVFCVTVGEYSDFHIEGIFSTREKAEAFIDVLQSTDSPAIEEWTLDERQEDRPMTQYHVWLNADGSQWTAPFTSREISTEARLTGAQENGGRFVGRSAKSFAHALKLASEFRQSYLRENPPKPEKGSGPQWEPK